MTNRLIRLALVMLNCGLAYGIVIAGWRSVENRYIQEGFYYLLLRSLPGFFIEGFIEALVFTALFFPAAFLLYTLTLARKLNPANAAIFSFCLSAWIFMVFLFGYGHF